MSDFKVAQPGCQRQRRMALIGDVHQCVAWDNPSRAQLRLPSGDLALSTVVTAERELNVAGIPAIVVEPDVVPTRLVLWQTHLGGSAQRASPYLHRLAADGCRAVSFDAPEHGARSVSPDPRAFAAEVLDRFRLRMWPILGGATLDALRVLDATIDRSIEKVTVGGTSMGGDIAIALAGIDPRVARVAVVGSTPDWSRPGMRRIDDPDVEIEQGQADSYGQWLREQLDPSLHPQRFRRGVQIVMHCGSDDRHIPEANARDFLTALGKAGDEITITRHPGLDHFGVCSDENVLSACLAHLTATSA